MKSGRAKAYILGGHLLAIALAGVWYWHSPVWTVEALRRAALDADASALSQRVDISALREQLRLRRGRPESQADDKPVAPLGTALAAAASDALLNAQLNLGSVQKLVLTGHHLGVLGGASAKGITWKITSRGLNVFRARADDAGLDYQAELMFRRDGLGWKLVGIDGIPEWTLADAERDNLKDLILDFPPNRQDRRTLSNGTDFLDVSGTITNVGASSRAVPSIIVRLRDSSGRVIFTQDIPPSRSQLEASEAVTINEAIVDIPANARVAEIGWKTRQGLPLPPVNRLDIATPSGPVATMSGADHLSGQLIDDPASQAERAGLMTAEAAAARASEAASLHMATGQ